MSDMNFPVHFQGSEVLKQLQKDWKCYLSDVFIKTVPLKMKAKKGGKREQKHKKERKNIYVTMIFA